MEASRIIAGEEDRTLPIPLTESECDEYARQLASEVAALSAIDTERKMVAKEWKDKREAQEWIVLEITRKVNTKTDSRLVRCEVLHDYRARKVEVVRTDTQETVGSRPMTRAEYERGMQMEL